MSDKEKISPLTSRSKKSMGFDNSNSKFRAVTEEVDGVKVRRLRGYPILFDVPGKPYRGSPWVEKIDKKALEGVDFSKLVLLLDHCTTWVLGRVGKNMTAVVDDIGLFIDVTLGNTWLDDYVFDRVQTEIIDGMSFFFDNKASIATDWENKLDVVIKINEVYEVSIVVFPAYEETVIITADDNTPDPEPLPADPPDSESDPEDDAKKLALIKLIETL